MTTETDQVIVDLMLKTDQQEQIAFINSMQKASDKVAALVGMIRDLAEQSNVSFRKATEGVEQYIRVAQGVATAGQTANIGMLPISGVDPSAGIFIKKQQEFDKLAAAYTKADNARMVADEKEIAAQEKKNALRVQEVAKAQEMAIIEDNAINKKQMAITSELQINNILAKRKIELTEISKLAPADQVKPIANILNQEMSSGLRNVNGLTKELTNNFGITADTIKRAEKEVRNMRNGFWNMVKEAFTFSAILDTAFGVGMAMLIFKLQMGISQFFTDVIQQARDLQNAIGKLSIVEEAMSKSGIEVTGKDLLNVVTELEKKWTNIADVDMKAAVGSLGLRLAEMGITANEIKDLMDVILAFQVKNPEKSASEIQGNVTQYVVTGERESVKALGVTFTEEDIRREAVRLGLIQNVTDEMSTQVRVHATISALKEKELTTEESVLKQQHNIANASVKLSASWKNLIENATGLVDIWGIFLVFLSRGIDGFILLLQLINGTAETSNRFQESIQKIFDITKGIFLTFVQWLTPLGLIYKSWENILKLVGKYLSIDFKSQPSVKNLEKQDTPTGPVISDDMANATEDNAKKIQSWLDQVADALDNFADRARNMEEDFKISMQKLADDYNLDVVRYQEDRANDRLKIVSDSNKALAEKDKSFKQKQLEDEAKFQEQLRQLREKYLMSLEDALHERDARQVLRLAREYAMNKQNMINENALKKTSDVGDHAAEMAKLAKQKADRLAEFDNETKLRLVRMKQDYDIRVERAAAEHKLEMQRLAHEKQDRLRQLADSIKDQLKLNQQGADAVYRLLNSYFGPKGGIDNMMKWTYENTGAYLQQMVNNLTEFASRYSASVKSMSGSGSSPSKSSKSAPKTGFASGGVAVADGPTDVTFGERSKELALFLPLDKLSSLMGASNGSNNQSGGSNKMELLVTLSPDLETRIVKTSLDNVSNAIMQVRKAR